MATQEQIEKLNQYGPYTIAAIKFNATQENYDKIGNFEQRVIDQAQAHLDGIVELATQVRTDLDRDLIQEQTPAPFTSFMEAFKFAHFCDSLIVLCS